MTKSIQLPTRKEIAARMKAEGFRIGAVMPIHYPRALLRAFNIHPMEVWGPPHVEPMDGPQHFPEYTCPIVQKATRFFLSPQADAVDCILIPHTCDSLQGMASVFKDFIKPRQPVFTLYHPRGRRQSDLVFMEQELRLLSKKLSEYTGIELSEERLHTEIDRESAADRLMREIAFNRNRYKISDREFYNLLRTREYLPVTDFMSLAESLPQGEVSREGPGILLSGIVPEPLDLFDHINNLGAHVVADDLACCSRRLYQSFEDSNPFLRLARTMLSMSPDPTVSTPYRDRFNYLKDLMDRTNAKAVIVYDVKFCEPELFYIPMFEESIKKDGRPFLYIENDLTTEVSEQALNRINSFVEMLS